MRRLGISRTPRRVPIRQRIAKVPWKAARRVLLPVPKPALAKALQRQATREEVRDTRNQSAQLRWLKRLSKKRWRPAANELTKRGKGAEPMSRAELYLYFKRIGNVEVFWSICPA